MGEIIKDVVQQAADQNIPVSDSGKDAYAANPNQKTYDQVHQTDHLIDVVDVFFGDRNPRMKTEKKQETYPVKSGGKIPDVLKNFKKEGRSNFTTVPDHQNPLKPGEKVQVFWEETTQEKDESGQPAFDYIKKTSGDLGCETWLVAKVNGDKGVLKVTIHEDNGTATDAVLASPAPFLEAGKEKTTALFKINGTVTYAVKIAVRPKEDNDFLELEKKIAERKDKLVPLYLKAEVTDTDYEIKFPDNNPEFYTAASGRYKAKYCQCCIYKIENNLLQGPNVIHTKTGSKVVSAGTMQKVIAIIMHRTSGWSTEGAVQSSKGTTFYVDGAKGNDGEIYQSMSLDKAPSHILSSKSRLAHLEVQSENSVGIEVAGWPYIYNEKKELVNTLNNKVSDGSTVYMDKGYAYEGKGEATYYWEKLTDKQVTSLVCLVKALLKKYDLTVNDIYPHDEIQSKNRGEGRYVMDIILPHLNQ
ncbi:N-acetylmuramoyl-L-alanine amidase [Niabella beijingensis]|uniref:peptidoglycan recognition protein family protein n=1 Tax=Niabella beijingensis TaxID=2872700 RepID=UPI001CBF0959|nr:N-acetylmuramoyl-L-alanine amidase [Niabella beijingensis]MBZ4190997.1 N-acetylmuramoyl-L-alanine amidase [Niabella beijingensis]